MTTTLEDAAAFATDPEVKGPLTASIETAAVSISNEDPLTARHNERAALAYQVLKNPQFMVEQFAWAVSTNATVVAKWTSGDKEGAINDFGFVVATVWDALAGPTVAPEPPPDIGGPSGASGP
jgi:hypothetical protein